MELTKQEIDSIKAIPAPDLSAKAIANQIALIRRLIPNLPPSPKRVSGVAVQNRLAKKARNIRKNRLMSRG